MLRRPLLFAAVILFAGCASRGGDGGGGHGHPDGGGPGFDAGYPDRVVPPGFDSGTWEGDPLTCDHALTARTYVGCEFWPTVLPNVVGTQFNYVVVVANGQEVDAVVRVERNGEEVATATVGPNAAEKIFLPWVPELKHFNGRCDTDPSPPLDSSARVPGGAYHLSSSVPVTVYQFNPLEYETDPGCGCLFGCSSYSNDASLLLPGPALTGNYRITAMRGQDTEENHTPGYISITGLEDGTTVAVRVGSRGRILAGGGISAAGPGELITFPVARGEVVRLLGTPDTDLAGTQVQGDHPVMVMTGAPCIYQPFDRQACDHIEESVFPAETLGRHYFVHRPTGPRGGAVDHVVRLYGNVDGTTLTYPGGAPAGAPTSIDAGETADLGIVSSDFEVMADHEIGVSTFMLGSSYVDPSLEGRGDPSQTNVAAVEQFREEYVFLAPEDYDVSYADIVAPAGADVVLDGEFVNPTGTPIGGGYVMIRAQLGERPGASHRLQASQPVGLQVMGYGFATSYHYPGGLDLRGIAPPPPDLI